MRAASQRSDTISPRRSPRASGKGSRVSTTRSAHSCKPSVPFLVFIAFASSSRQVRLAGPRRRDHGKHSPSEGTGQRQLSKGRRDGKVSAYRGTGGLAGPHLRGRAARPYSNATMIRIRRRQDRKGLSALGRDQLSKGGAQGRLLVGFLQHGNSYEVSGHVVLIVAAREHKCDAASRSASATG